MKRNIKIFLVLFLMVFLLSIPQVGASTEKVVAVDGASIRIKTETSSQGLRFYAKLDKSVSSNEHGFYLIYGEASVKELEQALATLSPNNLKLNGKEVFHVIIPGVTSSYEYSVVLTGIPEYGYEDSLTVIPYVNFNGVKVFASKGVTRSVVDVARNTYNNQPEEYKNAYKDIIDGIVSKRKIKVISSSGNKSYYEDFSDFNLAQGDTLELVRGNYNDLLTVNVNDVSIIGANKNKSLDEFGKRIDSTVAESIYNNDFIQLSSGVKNFNLNGLMFNGLAGVEFLGTHNDIKILYCNFKTSTNWIIRDNDSSSKIGNIVISHNYFYSNASYCRDIEFQGSVSDVLVSNNYFTNDLKVLDTSNYEYTVRFMKYEDNANIDIYQNTFNKLGSWYLIDVGYSHGSGSTRNVNNKLNLNIEDNKMTPHFETSLEGNGIRVMYLSDNSEVSIIRNECFRTSPYYNAILLTTSNSADSIIDASNLKIEIMHNKFYAEDLSKATKPVSRNEVTSRFTRIGLGVPIETDITLFNNYFSNSTSRYAYTFSNSDRASKNTNQIDLRMDEASTFIDADNGYNELLSYFSNRLVLYLSELKTLNEDIYAYYGGSFNEDITKYIPSFNLSDRNLLEIQNGKLVFVGSELYFKKIAQLQQIPIKEPTVKEPIVIDTFEDVVKTVAYSYYNKGSNFQYDLNSGRRYIIAPPEMGTNETDAFFDCSGFVNSVYYNAFGVFVTPETNSTSTNTGKIMDYARINKNISNEVIEYVLVSDVPSSSRSAVLNRVRSNLKVGDVIVYRYGSNNSGHTIIYMGNDTFLHSTGSSYDYDNSKDNYENTGTVELLAASEVFEKTTSRRYLFNDKYNFCVLRPLNREGLTLTDSTRPRMKYQGIDIEKYSSAPNFTDVTLNEEVTYYIKIKNLGGTSYKNFTVTHQVSNYVEVLPYSISHNGIYYDGKITYKIDSLKPNESFELEYTVKVNDNLNNVGEVLESVSFVESIPTNVLYQTIVQVNEEDKAKLANIISSFNGKNQSSSYSFFNDIYNDFAEQTNFNNPILPYSKLTDIFNSDLAVPYLYGGRVDDKTQSNNLKIYARNLKVSYFEVGDILMCYNGSIYKNYIYDGVNFLTYSSSKIDIVSGTNAINQVLDSANGYEKFKVIRPSLNIK